MPSGKGIFVNWPDEAEESAAEVKAVRIKCMELDTTPSAIGRILFRLWLENEQVQQLVAPYIDEESSLRGGYYLHR